MTIATNNYDYATAQLWVWPSFSFANSVAIELKLGWVPWPQRVWLHVANLLQLFAVGALAAAVVAGAQRFGPKRWSGRAVSAALASALACLLTLSSELQNFVERSFGGDRWALVGMTLAFSVALPAAGVAGRFVVRGPLRWPALALTWGAVLFTNYYVYAGYPFHQLLLLCSAAAFGGWAFVARDRAASSLSRSHLVAAAIGALGLLSAYRVEVLPLLYLNGAPHMRLFLQAGVIAKRALGMSDEAAAISVDAREREWFERRDDRPPVPASTPPLIADDAIVVLITVDAFRADVMEDAVLRKRLPYFDRLDRESVTFTNVRTPGASTAYTLTNLFSGLHYSQLWWTHSGGLLVWPRDDPQERFPSLLGKNGIHTVHISPEEWLLDHVGIVRGFAHEEALDSAPDAKKPYVLTDANLPRVRHHLEQAREGPLFLFTHLLDPHEPYGDALDAPSGSTFERYLQELEGVDRQLAAFATWLETTGLADRTTLIITSDHGEAFGEHGSQHHGSTLYEEMLRVPMWIAFPGVTPRRVDEPVSLIDVGPTVLDLMQTPTPGSYMGQSLVPFLRGESPELHRPIVAEGRLRQTLIDRDNTKVIRDLRHGTVEIYDLTRDPNELHNLASTADARYLQRLEVFFAAHTHPRYEHHAPYRK